MLLYLGNGGDNRYRGLAESINNGMGSLSRQVYSRLHRPLFQRWVAQQPRWRQ
jgi:hypothetical protein